MEQHRDNDQGKHENRRDLARTLLLLPNLLHARLRQPRMLAACGIGLLLVVAVVALAVGDRDPAAGIVATNPRAAAAAGTPADGGRAPPPAAGDAPCNGLLGHRAWTGQVSYSQTRDVGSDRRYTVRYSLDADLGAELAERNRRTHAGREFLVQYHSPEPQGEVDFEYARHGYSAGRVTGHDLFTASGGMRPQQAHMTEDGSSLSLTLKAADCSYEFHLQGQALGEGTSSSAGPYEGHKPIGSVHGQGIATSMPISGSARFPVLSRRRIEDNRIEKTNWVSELDEVSRALGDDNLGEVEVTWHFTPVD